jgi:ABC-2 type transport system ATP-binding protein
MAEAAVVGHDAAAVRAQGLRKAFGRTVAVAGADLEVRAGDLFGLIGPDGSGKSTLINAIAGVLAYDSGELDVLGVRVDSERAAERVKPYIGLMPQGLGQNLYGDLSIEENVDYFGRTRLVPPDELEKRKNTLLGLTRLDRFRTRPMKALSGGMKQKLGLVCTLIHHPKLILLDEPTTGVDPVSRRDFWKILSELVGEQGITAIVSTAYMEEAAYCNRIALMMNSRVMASGTEETVMALAPGTAVQFQTPQPIDALTRLRPLSEQVEAVGSRVRVFLPRAEASQAEAEVRSALGALPSADLSAGPPALEDVLVSLLLEKRGGETHPNAPPPPQSTPSNPTPTGTTPETVIEARDLVRAFGSFRAVDGVSFTVKAGEIFGLLGANGAGKTTAIKMLCGLIPPTSGYGRVAGADMKTAGYEIKRRIGYMSQAFSLYMDLTVWENFSLYGRLYGMGRADLRRRFAEIVDQADLRGFEHRKTKDLPMGLRQRLALGCATGHRPKIVFLDEPTSGVDALGRRQFWEQLTRMSREDGVAILVTTHFMAEAERCDHMVIMFAGKVFVEGTPTGLRADLEKTHGKTLSLDVANAVKAVDVARAAGFPSAAILNRQVQVPSLNHAADTEKLRKAFAEKGIPLRGATPLEVTLEDVFVQRVLDLERKRDAAGGKLP